MKKSRKVYFRGLFFCLLFGLVFSNMFCPVTAHAAKLKLSYKTLTMGVNETVKLKITAKPKGKVKWKSSNPAVAKVDKNGKIKARKAGKAVITAKAKGKKAICKITVKKKQGIETKAAAQTGKTTQTREIPQVGKTDSLDAASQRNAQVYAVQIREIVDATNQYRVNQGLPALKMDEKLTRIACYRSVEMAREHKMAHTRPDGSRVSALLEQYGISYQMVGENIGHRWGMIDVSQSVGIVDSWYASWDHRENMLNKKVKRIGVGIEVCPDGNENEIYYTQLFVY